ncbi:MAG TPA: NAD(P)H-hydrate epimerase, partial [Chitinophagaceae bacterium]|nr:NAD(P)H-hydrate epimerase [Chitinophagaceae bacterium]
MKILTADQIRSWDQYTMEHEPVASIDLMERAATKCFEWLSDNGWFVHSFGVFCGKGNNGGDGLAIARMLAGRGSKVSVYILEFGHKGTADFQTNLAKLHQHPSVDIHFIQDENNFHSLSKDTVIIDALF